MSSSHACAFEGEATSRACLIAACTCALEAGIMRLAAVQNRCTAWPLEAALSNPHLSGGGWSIQDAVQAVEVVQYQHPGAAQQVMQAVGHVEQGAQSLHILGGEHHHICSLQHAGPRIPLRQGCCSQHVFVACQTAVGVLTSASQSVLSDHCQQVWEAARLVPVFR